jgi:CheY-like chemotaxis protein
MTDGSLTLVREFRANPTVLADAALLGQAVRTVLGICANLHASDTAGTITVSIDQDDENGVIAFTSGIAGDISPVDEARIPDICCKSMHERERDISLLGLAGVTKIMGLHHGSFIVDPGDGGNTTISLALPRHEDPPAPLPEPGAHGAPATKPGREISVLIADDDISIRELLKTVLSSIGVTRCDSAANGEEACMRAMENDYDLIFMDVSMPVLSGLDAFKKIRAVKPAMKIIFITGLYQEDEIVEKLYKDNAYGYIRKPFNIAEIKKIVTGI